ncbi:Mor transcription activator family protein [Pseudoalteromonas luteoviolacea]|nr:Mor transcription activator family protein [Pseudoalteromonas luteoviolacea]
MMAEHEIDLSLLPHGVRKFVEVLGVDRAVSLLKQHQLRMMYIPLNPRPEHEFCQVFGTELAMHLSENHGAKSYQIPKVDKVLLQFRNQEIIKAHEQGVPVQELAEQYGLTRQCIWLILSGTTLSTGDPFALEAQLDLLGDKHRQIDLPL